MRIGEKGIVNVVSSQMSPDYLLQDWTDVYIYGDTKVIDMHNVMLFRGPIS